MRGEDWETFPQLLVANSASKFMELVLEAGWPHGWVPGLWRLGNSNSKPSDDLCSEMCALLDSA